MASSKKMAREMFVLTRYAWKDGSRILLKVRSIKGAETNDYTVTLWLNGSHIDTCDCTGFSYRGYCCHVEHFRLVEQLRTAMTSTEPTLASKTVLIEAMIASINKTAGKPVVVMGVSTQVGQEARQKSRSRKRKDRLSSSLDELPRSA